MPSKEFQDITSLLPNPKNKFLKRSLLGEWIGFQWRGDGQSKMREKGFKGEKIETYLGGFAMYNVKLKKIITC